jgi:ribosomal protein RSM22 (predicted rRNA methylase)
MDVGYSYVVLRRGRRPQVVEGEVRENGDQGEEEAEKQQASLRDAAYGWSRLIVPPLKRPGHVIFDACVSNGSSLIRLYPHGLPCSYSCGQVLYHALQSRDRKAKMFITMRGNRRGVMRSLMLGRGGLRLGMRR